MKELELQKKIIAYLRGWGYVVKVVVASRGGVPDLLCCIGGRFVAFEVKAAGGRVTPLQANNIEMIKQNGGLAYVVKSLDEVKSIVACITKGLDKISLTQ